MLAFEQIDLIDFTSPYETFYQCRDPSLKNRLINLEIAGPTDEMSTSQGLVFKRHISYDEVSRDLSDIDLLIVPGANYPTTEKLSNSSPEEFPVIKIIQDFCSLPADPSRTVPRVLLSICSGSFFLAVTGILANRRVTTHYLILKELQELCAKYGSGTEVVRKKFVDAGTLENGVRVVSSGGLTSGIDASLYAIELLTNMQEAERVSEIMDYQWIRAEGLI